MALFLDDFVEHLNRTYRPVMQALQKHGLDGTIERVGNGFYILIAVDNEGFRTEITDAGKPIPDSPRNIEVWRVTSPVNGLVSRLPGSSSYDQVAQTIVDMSPQKVH